MSDYRYVAVHLSSGHIAHGVMRDGRVVVRVGDVFYMLSYMLDEHSGGWLIEHGDPLDNPHEWAYPFTDPNVERATMARLTRLSWIFYE